MRHDRSGCAIGTQAPEAAASWDAMAMAFLAHGAATPTHLAAALAADPGVAIAHAVKGLFRLMLGRREMTAVAAEALRAARVAALERPLVATTRKRHRLRQAEVTPGAEGAHRAGWRPHGSGA